MAASTSFFLDRPVAPVVRLARPAADELDLDLVGVAASHDGFLNPEPRRVQLGPTTLGYTATHTTTPYLTMPR